MTRQRNPEAPKIGEKVKQALAGLALKQWKTPYAAAKALGLSETTLRRHMRGGKSRAEAREAQQKLTKAEEKVLVEWITRLTATGHPARHGFIWDMAEEIRRQRDSGGIATRLIIPLGICWVQQFISRHPQLRTVISRSIEVSRIRDVTRDVIVKFFDAFEACLEEYQITLENVYNMDETGNFFLMRLIVGFAIGTAQTSFVVVDSHLRKKYQAQPGRQEWVTAVECICADGGSISPFVIFKGKNLTNSWIPLELVSSWHFSCNEKGWTSNEHGEQWVKHCFDPATHEKANGQYRLLLCDGHDSHISAQFVRYCIDKKIILFLLPPHTSHLLQPLDVGVFGPLKTAMSYQLSKLFAMEISRLQKIEWVENYKTARLTGITSRNILGGWRGSGLFPTNPHRVLRLISERSTPSPSIVSETTTPYLISSSPPDVHTLRSANKAFNEALINTTLATPIRQHG